MAIKSIVGPVARRPMTWQPAFRVSQPSPWRQFAASVRPRLELLNRKSEGSRACTSVFTSVVRIQKFQLKSKEQLIAQLICISLVHLQKGYMKLFLWAEISSFEVSRSHTFTMVGQNFDRAVGGLILFFRSENPRAPCWRAYKAPAEVSLKKFSSPFARSWIAYLSDIPSQR